ncbi:MAG: GYD domain-containing protein [Bacteroidetes bacterium]|nr:GYD domain-containing protein [Bacteroidota bacterium]MBU1423019.1 GYD domain-containing protein [Bacteroidota bacterium]MBU2636388.1 GYD domain-containing protein [Bacteroidota bacterium]
MPTFILVTKLSRDLTKNPELREDIGKEWKTKISRKCPNVKWLSHYALLGPYDFIDIYEADSEEDAAKVSMITLSSGASVAESWTAIPYKRFLELIKEI